MTEDVTGGAIPEGSDFLRRIRPDWIVAKYNLGLWEVSSNAFQPRPESQAMSVTIEGDFSSVADAIAIAMGAHVGYGLVRLPAGVISDLLLTVERDPRPENPAHALIRGTKPRGVRKSLASRAEWVINPNEGVELPPLEP